MDKAGFLKRTALFSTLNDTEVDAVLATSKERFFADGKKIIREGHEGGMGFYLLLAGSAEVRKGGTVLATFGPGDYFGEMALLLDDTPRTADVVATSATTCLAITKWDLRSLIQTHPDVGVKMMAELAKRLADTDRAIHD